MFRVHLYVRWGFHKLVDAVGSSQLLMDKMVATTAESSDVQLKMQTKQPPHSYIWKYFIEDDTKYIVFQQEHVSYA